MALPVPVLHREQPQRDHSDDHPAGEEGGAEQQVQGDGIADDLGQVGGGRDDLCLRSERESGRAAQPPGR